MASDRVTVVNDSTHWVEMSRCVYISRHSPSVPVTTMRIKPWGIETIGVSKFANRSVSTPNLPMIRFFVDGVLKDSVVPAKMVQCVKIIIRIEKDGGVMTVWGLNHRLSDLFCCCFWPLRGFRFLGRSNYERQLVLIGQNEPPSLKNAQVIRPTSELFAWSPSLSPLSALSTPSFYSALCLDKLSKSAASSPSSLSSLSTLSSISATSSDELIGSGISEEEDEELLEVNHI